MLTTWSSKTLSYSVRGPVVDGILELRWVGGVGVDGKAKGPALVSSAAHSPAPAFLDSPRLAGPASARLGRLGPPRAPLCPSSPDSSAPTPPTPPAGPLANAARNQVRQPTRPVTGTGARLLHSSPPSQPSFSLTQSGEPRAQSRKMMYIYKGIGIVYFFLSSFRLANKPAKPSASPKSRTTCFRQRRQQWGDCQMTAGLGSGGGEGGDTHGPGSLESAVVDEPALLLNTHHRLHQPTHPQLYHLCPDPLRPSPQSSPACCPSDSAPGCASARASRAPRTCQSGPPRAPRRARHRAGSRTGRPASAPTGLLPRPPRPAGRARGAARRSWRARDGRRCRSGAGRARWWHAGRRSGGVAWASREQTSVR